MLTLGAIKPLPARNQWIAGLWFVFACLTTAPGYATPEPSTEAAAKSDAPAAVQEEVEQPEEPSATSHAIDEQVLLPLVLDFARSDVPEIQEAALLKAQEIKHPFLLPHIRYLARIASIPVRIVACETLAIYKNVQGLHELKNAANDADEMLAIRAIELLAEFPLPIIRQELMSIAQSPSTSASRKKTAIHSLIRMATPEAQEALLRLSKSLPEPLALLAREAQSLGVTSEPTRLLLLRRLFTAENLDGRLEALQQITDYFPSSQALGLFRTCLKDPEESIRRAVLKSAKSLEPPELEQLLKETLPKLEAASQRTWIGLVGRLPVESAIPLLLKCIQTDRDTGFRQAALRQLGSTEAHLKSPEATDEIIKLFKASATDPARLGLATALSRRPEDKAFHALKSSLGRTYVSEPVRLLAFETLLKRKPKNLIETLKILARDEPSLDIRKKAAAELVLNHCDELGDTCTDFDYHYPSDVAGGLYYTVSGAMGAASLGLLSKVAGGNQPVIAALSGAVLGSGTAYMLAPDEGVTMPEAFHFTSMGLWGSALGYGIGAIAVDGLDKPTFTWSFLGGQVLGTTLGALTFQDASHTTADLALMHWSGIEATSTTLGALLLWGKEDPSDYERQMGPAVATLAGLGLGVIPMWYFANDLEFSETDTALITLGSIGSGVLGSLAAYGTSEKDGALAGGFLLGQGLGYLATLTASQYVDLSPGELTWISLGSTLGSTLGAGIALTATDNDDYRSATLGAFIGGLTLTGAASLTADHFDLTWADSDLAIYSGLVGTVLGGSISLITNTELTSQAIIGASTGLIAGVIYDHLQPMSLRDSSLGASGALAGLILGSGLSLMLPDDARPLEAGLLTGTGTLLGYTSMLWAAPHLSFSGGDYLSTFGSVAVGAFVGGSVSGLIYGEKEDFQHTVGGTLLGSALGYGAGLTISQFSDMGSEDVAETLFITSLGGLLGQGLTAFTADKETSRRSNRILTLSGTGLGLAAGYLFADKTNYSPEDYWLISYLSAYGGFNGAWFPGLWLEETDDRDFSRQAIGGAMIGTVLGATSGILLSQYDNFTFMDVNEMALGSLASSIFGAGIGLMIPVDDNADVRPWVAGMQAAGILGTAAIGLLAPHTDFSAGDTTLGFLATAYGAWQGAGASLLLGGSERQVAGAVLATTALGAAGGAAISQYVDASTDELFAAFSGSVWGAWIGGMGSVALQKDFDVELSNKQLLGSFFVASDIGLIATALAMSPLVDLDPKRVGWINLYGLSGMALGSALGAIFPDVPFWTSNVSGSALGLIVGAVMTSFVEMPSLQQETDPVQVSENSQETTETARFYYPGQISVVMPQFQITPITGPDGRVMAEGNRFLLGFMGLWD